MYSRQQASSRTERQGGLATPRRNNYFHGKQMDVYFFELETEYGIAMRRLLNRLVTGDGVICGLDVVSGRDPCTVHVTAGMAIDGWGREIIVPSESMPIPIPESLIDRVCGRKGDDCGNGNGGNGNGHHNGNNRFEEPVNHNEHESNEGESGNETERGENGKPEYDRPEQEEPPKSACITAVLCYQECESDPVSVLAGECGSAEPCAPGSIQERYRISFEPGCADPYDVSCRFPDVLTSGELDYGALAKWVTRGCPDPPRNPCLPLANLYLDCRDDHCDIRDIDITIRPIVFGNAILFDMLSRIVEEERSGENRRR